MASIGKAFLHRKALLVFLCSLCASFGLNADILSLNFYAYGAANAADYHKLTLEGGQTAGYGTLNTDAWENVVVPWGMGDPQPQQNMTTRDGAVFKFNFNDVRNGGPHDYYAAHNNLPGDGDADMMDGHFNGSEHPGDGTLEAEFVVDDISFSTYDVVIYLGGNMRQYGDGKAYLVLNDCPQRDFTLKEGRFDSSFDLVTDEVSPGNFVVYKGLSGSSLKVKIVGSRNNHIGAAAIQIAQSGVLNLAVPPGSASNPTPSDGREGLPYETELSWQPGASRVSSNVYFGTNPNPGAAEFKGNQTGTTYDPGTLTPGTYYWRIDEVNADGTTTGAVWSMSVGSPGKASYPLPYDGMRAVRSNTTLKWNEGELSDSYDVYLGTNPSLGVGDFKGNQVGTSYNVGNLLAGTTYYWRIDPVNVRGTTTGDVWSFSTPKASAGKVKVFILAGQSNMQGHGELLPTGTKGTLDYLANNESGTFGKFKNGGNWATRNDVWIWYKREEDDLKKGDLSVGYAAYNDTIGPELQFGYLMGDEYNEQVLIIKTAWGGKSLYNDFRPPSKVWSTGMPEVDGDEGFYYHRMMTHIVDVMNNIETYFPAYADQGFEVMGFGWHQGWNDYGTEVYAQSYTSNLEALIKDVRLSLGVPNLPFVLASTGQIEGALSTFEQAQLAIGNTGTYPEFNGNVTAIDSKARGYYIDKDNSPANQGFHWNRNAKSYYHLGDGIGTEMLELLDTFDVDSTPPTVSSIADNIAGTQISGIQTITYTITFDEAIDPLSISASDFALSGTAGGSIDSLSATANPAVYTAMVTPTGGGTLRFSVKSGATITDTAGNGLDTSSAILDDEVFTIIVDTTAPSVSSIADNISGTDIFGLQNIIYTLTFNEAIDSSSVSIADFGLSGTASGSISSAVVTADPAVYTITVSPSSAGTLRFFIKSGASITDTVGNALNTGSAIQDAEVFTISTNVPSYTLTSGGSDSWNNASNWDPDTIPSGNADITINAGVAASAYNAATPIWNGALAMESGSSLQIEAVVGSENALEGATVLSMNSATIYAESNFTLDFPAMSLTGANTITSVETSAHSRIRNFDNSISSSGSLTFEGVNKQQYYFTASNSFSGGLYIAAQDRYEVFFNGVGSAGSGVLKVTPRSADGRSAVVFINAAGALQNVTRLTLNGSGWNNSSGGNHAGSNYKIVMNANDTVDSLVVDAVGQAPGTYGKLGHGSVDNEVAWISGNSVLTVISDAGSAFDSWASNYPTVSNTDASIDFDSGGISTGVEWAVGGDPADSNDDVTVSPTLAMQSGNYVFTYRRSDLANEDANTAITVEYSEDLVNWTTAVHGGLITITEDNDHYGSGYDRVTVTMSPNLVSGGKLYTRLKVVVAE